MLPCVRQRIQNQSSGVVLLVAASLQLPSFVDQQKKKAKQKDSAWKRHVFFFWPLTSHFVNTPVDVEFRQNAGGPRSQALLSACNSIRAGISFPFVSNTNGQHQWEESCCLSTTILEDEMMHHDSRSHYWCSKARKKPAGRINLKLNK